jgi:hypothetical protein
MPDSIQTHENRSPRRRALGGKVLLLLGSMLPLAACLGPNPWTVDPAAECRAAGVTPGTERFDECMLVQKAVQKTARPSDERTGIRACDMATGQCGPGVMR